MQVAMWLARIVGLILTILGLVDVPEQFAKWRELMQAMNLTGEIGRWLVFGAGIIIMIIATDSHRKVWTSLVREAPQGPQRTTPKNTDDLIGQYPARSQDIPPAIATIDPPEPIVRRITERFGIRHSNSSIRELAEELRRQRSSDRMAQRLAHIQPAPLQIEFRDRDERYRHVDPMQGRGIRRGRRQSYIVVVHNIDSKTVKGVEASLTFIDPIPREYLGKLPLPLRFAHEEMTCHVMDFPGEKSRAIEVVSFLDSLWQAHISIEHAVAGLTKDIDDGGEDGYEIEIAITGLDIWPPKPRKFKIGVRERELYMNSVPLSEEEAMQEGYDSESMNL